MREILTYILLCPTYINFIENVDGSVVSKGEIKKCGLADKLQNEIINFCLLNKK